MWTAIFLLFAVLMMLAALVVSGRSAMPQGVCEAQQVSNLQTFTSHLLRYGSCTGRPWRTRSSSGQYSQLPQTEAAAQDVCLIDIGALLLAPSPPPCPPGDSGGSSVEESSVSDGTRLSSLVQHVLTEIDCDVESSVIVAELDASVTLTGAEAADSSSVQSISNRLTASIMPLVPGWNAADLRAGITEAVDGWLKACMPKHAGPPTAKRPAAPTEEEGQKKRSTVHVPTTAWFAGEYAAIRECVHEDGEVRTRKFFSNQREQSYERQDLWVACRKCCSQLMRADHFRTHVMNEHRDEFIDRCGQAEMEAAKLALATARNMLAEVQVHALDSTTVSAATEETRRLHEQLADLRSKFDRMEVELSEERSSANYFDSQNRSLKREVQRLVNERDRRGWRKLCPTAELHQALYEAKEFEKPLNQTLDDLHYFALKRIELGDETRRGGAPMQTNATARALAYVLYNKTSASAYRLLRAVYRWLPRRKKAAALSGEAFVTTGCNQPQWGKQAFDIFKAINYDPKTEPFGICFDAAKVMGKLTWDEKGGRWVGQIDFNSTLGFDSWQDLQTFMESKDAAGYVLVFLLCPLNPAVPSTNVPVGFIPTNLAYTTADIDRYLTDIRQSLVTAGFGYVIPTTAADNPSVHRKHFLLCGNVRGRDREEGGSLGQELLEGDDAILTLGAHTRKGATCETAVTVDVTHTFKNGSLQPLHLTRFLRLGNYTLLSMMLVKVRVAAGLFAADVNNSDPMDVGAAERRLNVTTRIELAKLPENLGLVAYTWATACARSAWMDRDPSTTARMRVAWAFNNLVFLRWWLDWIEVTDSPAQTNFISMETHAAHVIEDQMLVMVVLLWGKRFPTKPFPTWLIGSDQCEHFFSEMRSMRINQADFTVAEALRLAQRYVQMLDMLSRKGVHLPAVFSEKGYNRSNYTPLAGNAHVQTEWLTVEDVRGEYTKAIDRLRPVFVALGCATALRDAGRWHRPSLEEWDSIEKVLDLEERDAAQQQAAAHRQQTEEAADDSSDSDEEPADDEPRDREEPEPEEEEETEFFPEKILKHRAGQGNARQKVELREFLIKWKGWSSSVEDTTWQLQRELIEDGNAILVYNYLQEHPALKLPEGLLECVAAEKADAGVVDSDDDEAAPEASSPPPTQPQIALCDMAAVLSLLTSRIGSEAENKKINKPLAAGTSAAQRKAYEATHVLNPATGQMVHKQAAAAHEQKLAKDATPGAGRSRYVTGERQPVIAEDSSGTGFACDEYYQLHIDTAGQPLNGSTDLMLEGALRVGYARVLELRKLNGKKRVLRLSVAAKHASLCSAVIMPLVCMQGRWVPDAEKAPPVLVPLLSLGRRVVATEGTDATAGTFAVAAAPAVVGGPALLPTCLTTDLFEASAMHAVKKDLMAMKVTELKEELEAREESKVGNKAWLRRRLHAAIVCDHLKAVEGEGDQV